MVIKYIILFAMLALLIVPPLLWRRGAYNSYEEASRQRAKRMMQERQREASRLLGIRENAKPDEVKRAHLRLMKKYHPDVGGSKNAAARINEAKDILLKKAA